MMPTALVHFRPTTTIASRRRKLKSLFNCGRIIRIITVISMLVAIYFLISSYTGLRSPLIFVTHGGFEDSELEAIESQEEELKPKITVLIVMKNGTSETTFSTALSSIQCYCRRQKYELKIVRDVEYPDCEQDDFMFVRHCIVATLLPSTDYIVFLDADVAVVNLERRIEEYIDSDFDIIFYERFFNWEYATGSYIVRNTPRAAELLMKFANYEHAYPGVFTGRDNGAFHMFVADCLLPELVEQFSPCRQLYISLRNWEQLAAFEACIRSIVGNRSHFHKIKILKKGSGWMRDIWLTDSRWNPHADFMLHGLQNDRRLPYGPMNEDRPYYKGRPKYLYHDPFISVIDVNKCSEADYQLPLDERLIVPVTLLRKHLSELASHVNNQLQEYIKKANRNIIV